MLTAAGAITENYAINKINYFINPTEENMKYDKIKKRDIRAE